MDQLPVWALWVDLVVRTAGTIGIGAFVAYIAHKQWKTAHQRIVLDLFERRMSVYEEIQKVVAGVVQSGSCTNMEFTEYLRAGARLPMLFGDEVVECYDSIQKPLANLSPSLISGDRMTEERLDRVQQDKNKIEAFLVHEFPNVIRPYVRMSQKLV